MRESKIRNYRPKFKSPFYPWIHIAGIIGFILLISQMGVMPILLVGGFIAFGFGWYWVYARDKIWREYCLLHVIERVTGQKSTGYLVDEELREVLIDRDQLEEKHFEKMIEECDVVDLYKYLPPDQLAMMITEKLSKQKEISMKEAVTSKTIANLQSKPVSRMENRISQLMLFFEDVVKVPLFRCQHCGECILSSTGFVCSQRCPKRLRNGPCGGTMEGGYCEVYPDRRCIWHLIYKRSNLLKT